MSITMDGPGPRTGKHISRKIGINRKRNFRKKSSTFLNKRELMKIKVLMISASVLLCTGLFVTPASSHHSFAMYDQEKTVVLTGVVKQFVAQANHAEIHFVLVAPD